MNVLIIGSGGREHALAWKISQSSKLKQLYIAPGNAGTDQLGTNLNIAPNDFVSIKKTVLDKDIKMVVIGPEDPLVKGIVDYFAKDNQLKESNHKSNLEAFPLNIKVINNRLLNYFLVFIAFILPVLVVVGVARKAVVGWHNLFYLHIFFSITIILLAIFRKTIPFSVKSSVMVVSKI